MVICEVVCFLVWSGALDFVDEALLDDAVEVTGHTACTVQRTVSNHA
jgi:hypothetical protein